MEAAIKQKQEAIRQRYQDWSNPYKVPFLSCYEI
jgi:hypothetical protein